MAPSPPQADPHPPLERLTRGDGPRPVWLLHGFLGSGRNLASLAGRWAKEAPELRFFMPDLPGHGRSPALPPIASLETMAEHFLAELDRAEHRDPVHVVGHSMGARIALRAAGMAPDRFNRVTMIDAGPAPIDSAGSLGSRTMGPLLEAPDGVESRDEIRRQLASRGFESSLVEWLLTNLERRGGAYYWRFDRQALADFQPRMTEDDLWVWAEPPVVPLHVVRGGYSNYIPHDEVTRLEAAGARVDTVDGAGHFVHIDRLDDLVSCLTS